jgi:hypothetical protein
MSLDMIVPVRVASTVNVDVRVFVGPATENPVDAPDEVQESERDQEPTGHITPDGLKGLQSEYGDAKKDTDKTKDDGTHHMAKSAERRHERGSYATPPACFGHGNEGKVMIRPQEGVRKPNCGGRPRQDSKFIRHRAFPDCSVSLPNVANHPEPGFPAIGIWWLAVLIL